ncbi:MAG: glycosyltransferase family 2 protein [Bryobacteraceae bacterium]|nr:glycosyltransferase family 2 protein [Bryobacteraceae bacterium]
MQEPQVTVIIVNHNRAALLERCLGSLLAPQGAEFEVVVVDNGSTDGSVEAVQRFAAEAPFRVTLIRNETNLGFCAANNQGIRASRAPFVALLNNDAEAEPGWLGALLEAFEDPRVGMAASKILVHEDPRVIDKAGHLIYLDGQNRGRGTGEIDRGQYDHVGETLWPDGCACMYRRAMLDEIGLFDEDLFAYGDDAELGLRARIAGWRCLYMPRAVARHRRGATLGVASPRRIALIERNRVLLAVKHFPWDLLLLNPLFYAARLAAGAWAALRGRGEAGRVRGAGARLRLLGALLRGDAEALARVPATLRKRRLLRPLRRLSNAEIRRLLWQNRIGLRALSEQAAFPMPGGDQRA